LGKAVVNIKTESFFYTKFFIESICKSKTDSGYPKIKVDSIKQSLFSVMQIKTGTAIYAGYKGSNYLITAKHVLFDPVFVSQKTYENENKLAKWDTLEAIFPRISIRTPFQYFWNHRLLNEAAVVYNTFVREERPYYFISDSTGDGIGIFEVKNENIDREIIVRYVREGK
jgi:hypothetical protein